MTDIERQLFELIKAHTEAIANLNGAMESLLGAFKDLAEMVKLERDFRR